MNKKVFLVLGSIIILIIGGWFVYHEAAADTYEGMSIIPEEHEDIPLFKGLKPTRSKYEIEGNQWEDIYKYYMEELPKRGWKVEYEESAIDDHVDWEGFIYTWQKEGFDGELTISGHYNKQDEKTEVLFDKTPIYISTPWVVEGTNTICIYETSNDEKCSKITDQSKIEEFITLVNEAIDLDKEKVPDTQKTSVIDFGKLRVTVHYGNDDLIYFRSEKGIKVMKPEAEFFELTNLSP